MKVNKTIQTTSTKCQYQAAASNPKWWFMENWFFIIRNRVVIKKIVPIITCKPWNPVATKKIDPKTLSAIEKGALKYSYTWIEVK